MYFQFQNQERPGTTWSPTIDVCERPDEIVIFVEMPGVERNDVQITWHKGVLTISGQKRQQTPHRGLAQFLCLERIYGHFFREIAINIAIDHTNAKAELRDGLMRIHLPKLASKPEICNIPII